jgi:O-antigen ligase
MAVAGRNGAGDGEISYPDTPPPGNDSQNNARSALFWRDRLFEVGLIVSMALYYLIGNANLRFGLFPHANPLISLPFLLIFAVLCWFRLPFALALLPISFPYYYLQKTVVNHYDFSLVEVSLFICVVVAVLRLLFNREERQYLLSWQAWRERLGPFLWPIALFVLMAAISIVIAYARTTALRAFREEVFDPLVYVALLFMYLHTRQDVRRLLFGMIGSGIVITVIGLAQRLLFRSTMMVEPDGLQRVYTVFGNANNVGLLFDYVLPLVMAIVVARVAWKSRIAALILCIPMALVIYWTYSRGSWMFAIPVAVIFVVACAIRNRKVLITGGLVLLVIAAIVLGAFHARIWNYLVQGHVSTQGHSTVTKRLYLWDSALGMIHDSPWVGYGMDNWLCHYSENSVCSNHLHHYWVTTDHGVSTGLTEEPTLSHPHNVFLQVWVSMGVFGMLAFIAVLVLFFWLFARILMYLHSNEVSHKEQWRWMLVGIGAAMLAAMVQGQGDSAFLEQDLSFFFWALVAALLLLRYMVAVPWNWKRAK